MQSKLLLAGDECKKPPSWFVAVPRIALCLYPTRVDKKVYDGGELVEIQHYEDPLPDESGLTRNACLFLLSAAAAEAAVLRVIFAFLAAIQKTPKSFCFGKMNVTLPASCISVALAWRPEILKPLVYDTWQAMILLSVAIGSALLIDLNDGQFNNSHSPPGAKPHFKDRVQRHRGNLTIILFMCTGAFGIEAMKTGRDPAYCIQHPSAESVLDSSKHADSVQVIFAVSAVGAWWSLRRDTRKSQFTKVCLGPVWVRWFMVRPIVVCETLGVVCFMFFYRNIGPICSYWPHFYRFAMAAARAMSFEVYALILLLDGLFLRTNTDLLMALDYVEVVAQPRGCDFICLILLTLLATILQIALPVFFLAVGIAYNPGGNFVYPTELDWIVPCP